MKSVFVPGRVNLIGEHTDYNEGLALPFAVDLGVNVTSSARADDRVRVAADGFGVWFADTEAEHEFERQAQVVLTDRHVTNVDLHVSSTLPAGAGMSSSAAYIGALTLVSGARGTLEELARLVQRYESLAGSDVGLLDPLATLGAREHRALLIDFSNLATRLVPIPVDVGFTVFHSGISRSLATSGYRDRRDECRAVSAELGPFRMLTMSDLAGLGEPLLRRRARHVLSENERVLAMEVALTTSDLRAIGSLLRSSHVSLRDDFEVSLPAIDALVGTICALPGVFGARLMGGGFGGCILAVHDSDVQPRIEGVRHWRVRPSDGALARLS